MRVPVTCTACKFQHSASLRDLPDAKLVCPLCDHEAQLPDESELLAFEKAEVRRKLLTVLGAGTFLLGASASVAYATLSESHPQEPVFGVALLIGAAVLGVAGLALTVVQENEAAGNYF